MSNDVEGWATKVWDKASVITASGWFAVCLPAGYKNFKGENHACVSALLALLLFVLYPIYAADVADVPQFKVNDTWKYGQIDLWKNERIKGWTHTVYSVEDQVVMAGVDEQTGKFRNFYTLEGNPKGSARRTYQPHMLLLSFPLSVGKSWGAEYDLLRSDGRDNHVTMSVKVLAFEKVTVPAGTFDAFKLKYHAYYRRQGEKGTGTQDSVYWYAPAVKRIVKEEYRETTFSGRNYDQFINQLESYKLAD